ncbi:DM13 domain-containing protein [Wenyingzhuangia sp. IMCC45574]
MFSQCVASAIGFGNNVNVPSYNVIGDVSITYENNKVIFKTGTNYTTANGPDVRVYLVNSEGKTDQQLIASNPETLPNISFGLVTFSGEQEIEMSVPVGVDLKDYDTVFFFCLEFTAFWDFGKINPIDVDNCSLSLENLNKVNDIKVFPNPVDEVLFLEGSIEKIDEFKVLDIHGRIVKQEKINTKSINLQGLSSGLYSLVLLSDTTFELEKIIKR